MSLIFFFFLALTFGKPHLFSRIKKKFLRLEYYDLYYSRDTCFLNIL